MPVSGIHCGGRYAHTQKKKRNVRENTEQEKENREIVATARGLQLPVMNHCKTKGLRQFRTDLGILPTEGATAWRTSPSLFVNAYIQLDCNLLEKVHMN